MTNTPNETISRRNIVWFALIAAMTSVGGLMWVLDGGPGPGMDGLALPALASAAGPNSIEVVFNSRKPIETNRWKAIVIHASGDPTGTPASIAQRQRQQNLTGLGFHFVIGNGKGIANGELHVAYRWLDQLPGAHVAGPNGDWYNRNAIGICLIGDGSRDGFTRLQMDRLVQLCAALARELDIPQDQILLHSDLARVASPGKRFPLAEFRQRLSMAD